MFLNFETLKPYVLTYFVVIKKVFANHNNLLSKE